MVPKTVEEGSADILANAGQRNLGHLSTLPLVTDLDPGLGPREDDVGRGPVELTAVIRSVIMDTEPSPIGVGGEVGSNNGSVSRSRSGDMTKRSRRDRSE